MTPRPWVYIIAGPNGAGKTTLARLLFPDLPVINPDEIARELAPSAPETAAFTAGRRALEAIKQRLRSGESFGVETTLSGDWIFQTIRNTKQLGFGVDLVYVGAETERLAVQRVEERKAAGGHGVPEPDIRRRYRRSLERLPRALAQADHALLYDNSGSPGLGPRIFAEIEDGYIVALEADRPSWFGRAMGVDIQMGTDIRSTSRGSRF